MNQTQFEQVYKEQWAEFSQILDTLESGQTKGTETSEKISSFPARYRRLCNHYGLAGSRHYSPALVDKLHFLVLRGHRQLYRRKSTLLWQGLQFIGRDFPQTVRADRKSVV